MMKLKKSLLCVLVLVLGLSLVVTGCSSAPKEEAPAPSEQQATEGDGSWARVEAAGKITAGLDDSYAPMGFRNEKGELVGFDIDMAAAISEKVGVPIEFVPADWNAIVPSILSSKFDLIISGMNTWPERKEQVDFVEYGVASQMIVVKADYPDADKIESVEFFLDKKIGSQLGSTGAKEVGALGFVEGKNMSLYKTFPEAVLDLDNGRTDAVVIDSFGVSELTDTGKYITVGKPIGGEDVSAKIGIAVRKEDKELQAKLQQAVDELVADGTLKELSEKWIGVDITEGL